MTYKMFDNIVCILIVCFILLFAFWRRLQPKKRICYLIILGIVFAGVVLLIIYFNSSLITFSTPEAAYKFDNCENPIIVLKGKETTLTAGPESKYACILNNVEDGWKIKKNSWRPSAFNMFDEYIIMAYQDGQTESYYIEILAEYPIQKISDNLNSEFKCFEIPNSDKDKENTTGEEYYIYIEELNDDYKLTIDGTEIGLEDIFYYKFNFF